MAVNVTDILEATVGEPVERWGWQLDVEIETLATALLGLPPGGAADTPAVQRP
jgi:hypothetical protein